MDDDVDFVIVEQAKPVAACESMQVQIPNDFKLNDAQPSDSRPSDSKRGSDVTCLNLMGLLTLVVVVAVLVDAIYLSVKVDEERVSRIEILTENPLFTRGPPAGINPCTGKKPTAGFENFDCFANNVVQALEQS
eukprot:176037-Amphidinium_carterae.1